VAPTVVALLAYRQLRYSCIWNFECCHPCPRKSLTS